MNKKLIDGLQRHFALTLSLGIRVQPHWSLVGGILLNLILRIVAPFLLASLLLIAKDVLLSLGRVVVLQVHYFIFINGLQILLLHPELFITSVSENNFLIAICEIHVLWNILVCAPTVCIFVHVFKHVFGDALRHTQGVDLFRSSILHIWDKMLVFHLLLVELFRIYVSHVL